MNVELYVKTNDNNNHIFWKKVDLSESIDYSLNKQFIDLEDLTSITTDYSKTVKIPFTPSNNELFNYLFKVQHFIITDYFDPTQKIDIQLRWNANIILEGYAILNDIDSKNKTYNITIYAETNRLIRQLLNTTISDIEGELVRPDRKKIMENIKITPYYVNQSFLNGPSTNGYVSGIVNSFTDIIGFAPQKIDNSVLDTKSCWDSNKNVKINISDYIANAHSDDENYNKDYITPFLENGLSFPEYPEINCYTTKGYFYADAMIKIIKEYIESSQIGYEFDITELEEWGYLERLVYFFKDGFNLKENLDTDEKIEYTELSSYLFDFILIKDAYINSNKFPHQFMLGLDEKENDNIRVYKSYGLNSKIYIFNKLNEEQNIKFSLNVSNIFNIQPNPDNSKKIRFYNLPNLPYVYLFKEDIYNDNTDQTIDYTVYYADVIVPPLACELGLGKKTADEVIKWLKDTYTINDSNINIIYIDNKSLHQKLKVLKVDGEDIEKYEYTIDNVLTHDLKLLPNRRTGITQQFIPVDVTKRTYDTTNALVFPYEYQHVGQPGLWLPAEYESDRYYLTSEQNVNVVINNISFITNKPVKYQTNWINLKDFLGKDFKPFEWFLNLCKKYRLYIDFDFNNNKIKVFKHYFTQENGLKIINKQIDYNKDVTVKPIINDYKTIYFGYKTDDIPTFNKKYYETNNVSYGDLKIPTQINLYDKELKLSKGNEIIYNTDYFYNFYKFIELFNWDTISSLDMHFMETGEFIDDTYDNKLLNNEFYLYRVGAYTQINFRLTNFNDGMISTNNLCYYPFRQSDISQEDIDNGNVISGLGEIPVFYSAYINAILQKPFNTDFVGIYSERWENYLDEIFDVNNKKITCYVPLSVAEYYNFRFNQLWNIEGNLFIVNKIIDYNPTNNEPTKVELIQVNNIENYN